MFTGYSVLYSCIQFAYFFGIETIYLLGVDFNYNFSSSKLSRSDGATQMYESEGESNHFHPDYKKAGEIYYDPNLEHQKLAFIKARQVFEDSGRSIYNATRGGRLEVFPRVEFDCIF